MAWNVLFACLFVALSVHIIYVIAFEFSAIKKFTLTTFALACTHEKWWKMVKHRIMTAMCTKNNELNDMSTRNQAKSNTIHTMELVDRIYDLLCFVYRKYGVCLHFNNKWRYSVGQRQKGCEHWTVWLLISHYRKPVNQCTIPKNESYDQC